ncbi:MAG: TerL [Spartobacteria bacterium]|nr:TerL [Spartobacteria bacterium]
MNIVYNAEHTAIMFHASHAFVRGIMGPLGSGKSVACTCDILARCALQAPDANGTRKTRWSIIRNTYPELRSTTIKTFTDWCPNEVCEMNFGAPITGRYKRELTDGTKIDAEIFFLALDKPKDIKKLLSLELTGAWVNEAREISKTIIDAVTSRVGRFPAAKDGGPTWSGVIMDTNPPDDDHWWYKFAEEAAWRDQTSEVDTLDFETIENLVDADTFRLIIQAVEKLKENRINLTWDFFRQPGALIKLSGNRYVPNPAAENVRNQPLGYYYWLRMLAGKDPEWIKVYILGDYGNLFDGKPVYEGVFNDRLHVSRAPLVIYPGLSLYGGWDYGLTPAFVLAQQSIRGQLRVLREYNCGRGGIRQFIQNTIVPALNAEFTNFKLKAFADPAGAAANQVDMVTCIQECNRLGIPTVAAPTNDFIPRRDAVINFMTRLVDGEPAYILDPSCVMLRKGFKGGYFFERVQVPGEERYKEVACKNQYSHGQDANQYLCLGLDPAYRRKRVTARAPRKQKTWNGF